MARQIEPERYSAGMRPTIPALALPLLLFPAACDIDQIQPGDANAIVANTSEPLRPGTQPVRIGESGPQFQACATRGTVLDLGGETTLPVRAAPFSEAEAVGEVTPGTPLFVCTRTIDQRWLGVVVPPPGEDAIDCGVSAPVERPRSYAGPCLSGWVTNGFVRLRAG